MEPPSHKLPRGRPKGIDRTRVNVAQMEERINLVFDLLIKGASRSDVIQFFSKQAEKNPEMLVSVRSVDIYIRRANQKLSESAMIYRDREVGLAVRRLTDIYKNCRLVQDWSRALAAQKELHALLGLYPEHRLTVNLTTDQDAALKAAGINREQLIADVIAELFGGAPPAQLSSGGEDWIEVDPEPIEAIDIEESIDSE